MDLGLIHKIAFAVASSQGIGNSVPFELAQEGANIIIYGRNKKSLEKQKKK